MLKRCLSLIIAVIMTISVFTVFSADISAEKTEIAESGATSLPNSLFLQQSASGMCTLSSIAMMLRARMYLSGNSDWERITESTIRSVAWMEGVGVRYSFTYTQDGNSMSVSHANISGISVSGLKSLLNSHPEGIMLLCYDVPHAVLVTDYEGDTFYCADPANTYSGKRIKLASSYTASVLGSQSAVLNAADAYWYVSSYSITGNINLGNDFYAVLANSNNNKAIGLDPDWNVTVRDYQCNNDQIWHFIRQSDGGYRLINVYTDIFLIGDNIATLEPQAGPNNKTWYIRKIGSGYGLAHYSSGVTKYLRPYANSWSNGTILTLTTAQANININIISGNSNKPQSFDFVTNINYTHDNFLEIIWNKSKYANDYTVNVWKDNGEHLVSTSTRENSFYLYDLETGYYGVYIKAHNAIGNSDKIGIHFHITKDVGDKDFCGLITDGSGLTASYDVNSVILDEYRGYDNQAWNFFFQTDGSYLIQNSGALTYLAADGESVFLTDEIGESTKWYIGGYEEDDWSYLYHINYSSGTLRLTPTDGLWEDGSALTADAESWDFYQIQPLEFILSDILGDADSDGAITVMDATAIQKRLANLPVSINFSAQAADVTGDVLDISDASFVQKYVSKYAVPYLIGKPIGYVEPQTEAPTEEATVTPTEAETTADETQVNETQAAETQPEETQYN